MRELLFLVTAALFVALAASACTPVSTILRGDAGHILLKRGPNPDSSMRRLARVECAVELPAAGHDYNAKACENQLLNQAAELGASLVVVEIMQLDSNSAQMRAVVYAPLPAATARPSGSANARQGR